MEEVHTVSVSDFLRSIVEAGLTDPMTYFMKDRKNEGGEIRPITLEITIRPCNRTPRGEGSSGVDGLLQEFQYLTVTLWVPGSGDLKHSAD
jgi:hypothetical protein